MMSDRYADGFSFIGSERQVVNNPVTIGIPEKPSSPANTDIPINTKNMKKIAKTFKLPADVVENLSRLSYWRRKDQQVLVVRALRSLFDSASPEELQPIPEDTEDE